MIAYGKRIYLCIGDGGEMSHAYIVDAHCVKLHTGAGALLCCAMQLTLRRKGAVLSLVLAAC